MKGISDSIGDKDGYDGFSMEGRMEPRANLRYFAKKKGGSYIPINKGLSCTKLLQSAQKHDEAWKFQGHPKPPLFFISGTLCWSATHTGSDSVNRAHLQRSLSRV